MYAHYISMYQKPIYNYYQCSFAEMMAIIQAIKKRRTVFSRIVQLVTALRFTSQHLLYHGMKLALHSEEFVFHHVSLFIILTYLQIFQQSDYLKPSRRRASTPGDRYTDVSDVVGINIDDRVWNARVYSVLNRWTVYRLDRTTSASCNGSNSSLIQT